MSNEIMQSNYNCDTCLATEITNESIYFSYLLYYIYTSSYSNTKSIRIFSIVWRWFTFKITVQNFLSHFLHVLYIIFPFTIITCICARKSIECVCRFFKANTTVCSRFLKLRERYITTILHNNFYLSLSCRGSS